MIVLCDYKMLSVVREFQVDGGGGYYILCKHKIVHAAADVNTTKRYLYQFLLDSLRHGLAFGMDVQFFINMPHVGTYGID